MNKIVNYDVRAVGTNVLKRRTASILRVKDENSMVSETFVSTYESTLRYDTYKV